MNQQSKLSLDIPTARIFRPLLEDVRYKGAYGGRGSGKSHFFAESGVEYNMLNPGARGVCVREVQRDLKESAKLLIEDKIKQFGLWKYFDIQERQIKSHDDGMIIFRGMNDYTADSIKSLAEFDWCWVEEAHTLTKRSLELLRPTMRKDTSQLWFSWNPRHETDAVDLLFRGPNRLRENVAVVQCNYRDNRWFPAVLEEERKHDQQFNPDRYGHIWLGHYEPQAIGAIWDRATIERNRRSMDDLQAAGVQLERIVVAVDPAGSAEEYSDSNGIVVCAYGSDGRGYVLEDVSIKGTPRGWSQRTLAMFDKWDADTVVVERYGGDMPRHVLETARPGLPVIDVAAKRGKHLRAEPISALYHIDRISHVGAFSELEDQMCLMTAGGYEGKGSPDRIDAMVYGMTELFPELLTKPERPEREHESDYAGPDAWMCG